MLNLHFNCFIWCDTHKRGERKGDLFVRPLHFDDGMEIFVTKPNRIEITKLNFISVSILGPAKWNYLRHFCSTSREIAIRSPDQQQIRWQIVRNPLCHPMFRAGRDRLARFVVYGFSQHDLWVTSPLRRCPRRFRQRRYDLQIEIQNKEGRRRRRRKAINEWQWIVNKRHHSIV